MSSVSIHSIYSIFRIENVVELYSFFGCLFPHQYSQLSLRRPFFPEYVLELLWRELLFRRRYSSPTAVAEAEERDSQFCLGRQEVGKCNCALHTIRWCIHCLGKNEYILN